MTQIEIHHNAPLTVSVDINALLRSEGEPEVDFEGDLVGPGSPLWLAIVGESARLLAADATKAMKQAVADLVVENAAKEVEAIVSDVIENGAVTVTNYGSRVDVPPLREVIAGEVKAWLKGSNSSSFRDASPLAKLVKAEVDNALKRDFSEQIKVERGKIVDKMKDIAAALLATEATKR